MTDYDDDLHHFDKEGFVSSTKSRASRKRDVLAGNTPDLQLYRGVRRYVESLGGSVIVIGGIEIQEWPDDPAGKYRVAVSVLGRRPEPRKSP